MKRTYALSLISFLAAIAGTATATAADWTHLMGPKYDRKTAETLAWSSGSLRKVWEIPATGGFSSFVTGDGRAYTVVARGETETVIAVDRKTGKTLWETPMSAATYPRGGERGASGNEGGDGPRATPVFAGGRVYVCGAKFDLYALDAATGKAVWQHDLLKEFGGKNVQWLNAASPLVVRDRVFVAGGGGQNQTYLAFRADTGALIWKSGTDKPTYTSPILTTIHGKEQVLFMMERGAVSLDPETGRELWHFPFPFRVATAVSPVVWQDIVHVTAGYGVGGGAAKVTLNGDKWDAAELWRSPGNRDTASHWMTPVVHEGFMYGCYGHGDYGAAAFKCIDIRTGKVRWEQKGFGHGQVIMAGNRLLAISDAGRLVMLEPTPEAYRELASMKAIEGKIWASLALSDGQLLLRSTTKGVCLSP